MIAHFTAFAKTGTPAAPDQIAWTPFQTSAAVLHLDQGTTAYFDAGAADRCGFRQRLYPNLLSR